MKDLSLKITYCCLGLILIALSASHLIRQNTFLESILLNQVTYIGFVAQPKRR